LSICLTKQALRHEDVWGSGCMDVQSAPGGKVIILGGHGIGWLVYSCCSHLEHRTPMKRFVSLQFLCLKHSVGLLGRMMGPSQGRYLTQTDIHASSGIRNHSLSVRMGEDSSCLRQRGHCDRQVIVSVILSKKVYMYMCPIPNGFRDRAISLYRTVLYTVQTSNTPCPHTSC
jgi:hypothetical protein